jgi:hypothetical protein
MLKRVVSLIVVAGVWSTGVTPSMAQELDGEEVSSRDQPVKRRFETKFDKRHDRGVYVRMSAGVGWASGQTLDGGTRVSQGMGVGLLPSLAVGSVLWEGTALHGGVWGLMSGNSIEIGVGPGLTHYFDPAKNLWISAQAGPVTRPSRGLSEWAAGGELEGGVGGWTGDHCARRRSLFGGGTGGNFDGNDRRFSSWRIGLRLNLVHN